MEWQDTSKLYNFVPINDRKPLEAER